ncbi:MAG: serine/threonine-protein kinase [Chloroflexi bacterium OHK40]
MSELHLIGTTLGRFEILSELGRGGMAVVYKARQTDLDRIVALKILPPSLTHDAGYVARFRQEARSAARLEHPHIMPIYEVGEANGLHYIAMKYIQGRTLKDLVHEEGALSVQRAATILAQVGDALDYAHRQGVIHRDIKPSNMMITDEGWVYLTDFGLARGTSGSTAGLTMAGTVMGTPEYMSPEQAQGLPNVGPPTDIYALGVVLYELLTGTFPFQADTPMGMLAARLLQAPTPPRDVRGDLPPAVEDVVMRALARKPEARFASAAQMMAALRAATGIAGQPEPQRPATPVGGTPAIGDTIRATPPPFAPTLAAPASPTPPSNPPYVRQAAIPAATAPMVGPAALPTPAPASAAPATPAPRRSPNNLVVIGIALGVAALACVALMVVGASQGRTTPSTSPTAVAQNEEVAALLDAGDAALAEAGGLPEALASYQQAREQAPGDPAPIERLALAASAGGRWASAEEYANELIDTTASSDSQVALGYAILADALHSQGDIVAAEREIATALSTDPDLAFAHAVQSNIQAARAAAARSTPEMDAALDTLGIAEDALGDETPLLQALTYNALGYTFAQEYMLSGNEAYLEQSLDSYERAIDLQPAMPLFHANLAALRSIEGDYTEARELYAEALELDPGYAAAQAGIGWSYYQEDDREAAAEAFDTAIALDEGYFEGYYGKGRLAFDAAADPEAYAAAAELLREAAARNPHSAEVQAYLGEALLFQGFGSEDNSDAQKAAYAESERAYREAIARNDRYPFALSGLGWILQYQERYDESIATFEQALALDDRNDEIYAGLGWSLYWTGAYAEAEANFRNAIAHDEAGTYASAHYGLGRALQELGRLDEARAAYESALAIDPDYRSAQEALAELGS